MDANQGEPWSEMDIKDLRASLDFGNTYADAARMLCRDEDEVRQKAKARTGRATKKMVTSKRPREKCGTAALGKKAPDLTGCAHHAIAEALHVELAHVAFPVRAFGLFLADQGATVFLQ
jgi:hypothetical protein